MVEWSPQQDEALIAVSTWLKDKSGPQVFRLFGWAGTGKSTLARHLAQGVRNVKYAAFTGKAAQVMRRMGCRGASTIHSLIYSLVSEKEGEPTLRARPRVRCRRRRSHRHRRSLDGRRAARPATS